MCVLLAALLLPADAAPARQAKLRDTLQGPITHPFYGATMTRFKQEVERISENGIAIEIFDKSRLYTDSQVVAAVSSGAIEIGITASHEFAIRVLAVRVLEQRFLFNSKSWPLRRGETHTTRR